MIYINPTAMRKEAWLSKNGKEVSKADARKLVYSKDYLKETVAVCLVENGRFTAAAILATKADYEAFTYEADRRPKTFWKVPRSCFTGDFNGKWAIVE